MERWVTAPSRGHPLFSEVPVRHTRTLLAVLAAGMLTVPLAACGGDDGGALSAINGDDNSADSNAADDASDDATADDTADDTSDDTSSDDSSSDGETGDFCLNDEWMSAAASAGFSGDSDDPEDIAKFFDEMADEVPDEISDDFHVFADAMGEYLAILADFDGDDASMFSDPEVMAALEKISTPEVQEASDNISAWMEANC
jgi:hypothetical protein